MRMTTHTQGREIPIPNKDQVIVNMMRWSCDHTSYPKQSRKFKNMKFRYKSSTRDAENSPRQTVYLFAHHGVKNVKGLV